MEEEEAKPPLFSESMILNMENSEGATEKTISTRVARYKMHIQKSIISSNERYENEMRKTVLFETVSERIKYLGMKSIFCLWFIVVTIVLLLFPINSLGVA